MLNRIKTADWAIEEMAIFAEMENSANMETANMQISDFERDFIEQQIARQSLLRCVEIAEQTDLSSMTMDEINAEIEAVRQSKKNLNRKLNLQISTKSLPY